MRTSDFLQKYVTYFAVYCGYLLRAICPYDIVSVPGYSLHAVTQIFLGTGIKASLCLLICFEILHAAPMPQFI
jgi:hypothetical protein